jgi:NAD(P)-dependent dehydrogenase (short-subunit alcohol dehydrogenase family)
VGETTGLLRPGLLGGVSVLVAGATEPRGATGPAGSLGAAVGVICTELGARVAMFAPGVADGPAVDGMVRNAVAEARNPSLLVVDAAGLLEQGSADGREARQGGARAALSACLDATWNVTRAVASVAFMAGEPDEPSGQVIYLAPPPSAGRHADAALAGLENLSRTLSIEWARHAITLVTVAPGETTTTGEVAALTAYLASPAGAYFSGCLLDLRGP